MQEALTRGEEELTGLQQARQQERAKLGGELDMLRQERDHLTELAQRHQAEALGAHKQLEAAQKLLARLEQDQWVTEQDKAQAQKSLQQLNRQLQDAGEAASLPVVMFVASLCCTMFLSGGSFGLWNRAFIALLKASGILVALQYQIFLATIEIVPLSNLTAVFGLQHDRHHR